MLKEEKKCHLLWLKIPNQGCRQVWTQELLPTILDKGRSTGLGVKDLYSCQISAISSFYSFT